MKLLASDSVDTQEWNRILDHLGGSFFHTVEWAEHRCHDGRGSPVFFQWSSSEQPAPLAAALGIVRFRFGALGRAVLSRLCIDSPPAMQEQRDLLPSLRDWSRNSPSISEISLGSFDARWPWLLPASGPVGLEKRCEYLMPARRQSADEGFRKGIRYSIKKAARSGVDVQKATSAVETESFAQLLRETGLRLKKTKGVHLSGPDDGAFARSLYRLIRKKRARLFVAMQGQTMLAGCFFGEFAGSAYYLLGGASEAGLQTGATALALQCAIEEFTADSFARINLGGTQAAAREPSSIDHGLHRFKLGFGAEPMYLTGGRIVTRPTRLALTRVISKAIAGSEV